MKPFIRILPVVLAGVAFTAVAADDLDKALSGMIRSDLRSKGPATLERVTERDEAQRECSNPTGQVNAKLAAKIEAAQLKTVKYPSDGKFVGDWKEGEKIAQNGRGNQFSDPAGVPNGGNCYACHQITKEEIAYGTIGPTLYQYGKLRGNSDAVVKYTWAKLYNAQAFKACSLMPRFGHHDILTEQQIRDLMALLLDPASPVNK